MPAHAAAPEHVAERIEEMPPDEAAQVLQGMAEQDAAAVAEALDPNTAADFLSELDSEQAARVIGRMNAPEASLVLSEMDPDDRVDVLEHVPDDRHDELLAEMTPADAAEVRQLEQYPSDTAGGIMTTEVTALYEYITVDNAVTLLRRLNEELEQMFYVYVVNRRGQLVGVLSMRDLILASPDRRLRDIMIRSVKSVPATMDQEQVAREMKRLGYLAIPVVDASDRLIGLITLDDIVEVLEEETTEDMQRMFGAGAEERLTTPWQFSFRKRFWWLMVNLATAFLAAAVVGAFEGTIQRLAILAAFLPIVAGMGGNASAQAMAVAVRGLAISTIDRNTLRRVLRREAIVGALTGLLIGLTTAVIALTFRGSGTSMGQGLALGLVVGLSLLVNHTLACTSGAAIPFVMRRLGFDPAQSATIFATTVTDVAGFLVLLGLAALAMPWLL